MRDSVSREIEEIREIIAETASRAGRDPSDVKLMAVTKSVDDERIMEAIEAGADMIGENYVQEAKRKIEKMGRKVPWHMIGHLQTNKAKYAVRLFDLVHSVNRIGLAQELARRSSQAGLVSRVLIEVNLSGEPTKSGAPPDQALSLIRECSRIPGLSIQGLMTMAPWSDNPEDARPFFRGLRQLRDRISGEKIEGISMKELSMGMSDDFQVAIEEGATIVRIGRRLFGERQK
ncbi:MAG TPA: YggS family pyridoxal phosphate-dependent enzyme [Syntrophales bacterium]|nr:YggS family pyridoxal phosphate-dependent enzyme [Syntrophales bacterium]